MAEEKRSSLPPPPLLSNQNGRIKCPVPRHHNGSLEAGPGCGAAPPPAPGSRASSSPLRTLRTLGGLMSPVAGPGPEGSPGSSRPRGQSLGSALSSKTRSLTSRTKVTKRRNSQQEEPEDLLDLILESQGQRLEDQRASLSLLPDPGPEALCGACSPDQPPLPSLDFYYMLIHYQSDRMEDQRCSLPDLDDVVASVPDQEDFFSLVQRVQSRRMEEQRAALTHREEEANTADSSPHQRP